MRYTGGKYRLRKHIGNLIKLHRKPRQIVIEPFVGAANVTTQLRGVVLASDIDADLAALWNMALNGWAPPTTVTEDEYYTYRDNPALLDTRPHLRAFIKHGCAYGGKRWGPYAKDRNKRNYVEETSNSIASKARQFSPHTFFFAGDYTMWSNWTDAVIYCDPPYRGTYSYGNKFDHDAFWDWVQFMSQNNTVLVSEYNAPDFMEPVWSKETITNMNQHKTPDVNRTEVVWRPRQASPVRTYALT